MNIEVLGEDRTINLPSMADKGPLPKTQFLLSQNVFPDAPDENFPIIIYPHVGPVHDISRDLYFFAKMRGDIKIRDVEYIAIFKIGAPHEIILTCDLPREEEILVTPSGMKFCNIIFKAERLPRDKGGYVARAFSSGKMIAETLPILFYDPTIENYNYDTIVYNDVPLKKSGTVREHSSDSEHQSTSKGAKKKKLIRDAMDDSETDSENTTRKCRRISRSKRVFIQDDMDSDDSFDGLAESEYIAVEDPLDPGLIVFKSRADEMKDEICKLTREKKELEKRLILSNENILLLKKELEKVDEAASHLNNSNKVLENSVQKLKEELQQYESQIQQHESQVQLQQMHSTKLQDISDEINSVKSMVVDIKESSAHISRIHLMMENMMPSSLIDINPQPHNGILFSGQDTPDNNLAYVNEDVRNPTLPSTSEEAIDLSLASNSNNEPPMQNVPLVQNERANYFSNYMILENNNAFRNELNVIKEENASLKSRVSVLETELGSASQNTYPMLMACLRAYEHENSHLKSTVKRLTNAVNKLNSLKKVVESLKDENHLLKSRIYSSPGDHYNYLMSQIQELQATLRIALQEKEFFRTQLMELRKNTIGRVIPSYRYQ